RQHPSRHDQHASLRLHPRPAPEGAEKHAPAGGAGHQRGGGDARHARRAGRGRRRRGDRVAGLRRQLEGGRRVKLGSLKSGGRDGSLIVLSRDLARAAPAGDIAPTLQAALDDWDRSVGGLRQRYEELEQGRASGTFALKVEDLAAPLPRAYQFLDGSAYLAHVERVRRARGAEMPPSFLTDPLMYQAVSDGFLPPVGTIPVASEEFGMDFE